MRRSNLVASYPQRATVRLNPFATRCAGCFEQLTGRSTGRIITPHEFSYYQAQIVNNAFPAAIGPAPLVVYPRHDHAFTEALGSVFHVGATETTEDSINPLSKEF
nr:Hypothetical_protein [Stutzerimonas stutzeri]